MWPDRVSNPGPLVLESDAVPTALCDPAYSKYLFHVFAHYVTFMKTRVPYKFYILGQIGLSKQCRPRSDCF